MTECEMSVGGAMMEGVRALTTLRKTNVYASCSAGRLFADQWNVELITTNTYATIRSLFTLGIVE